MMEKKIIIKNPLLQNLRNSLRKVIVRAVFTEDRALEKKLMYGKKEERPQLKEKLENLRQALRETICRCELCTWSNKDMIYFPTHETWYCIECWDKGKVNLSYQKE